MALHIIGEANRCLNCKKPMCQRGCPVSTTIPGVFAAGDVVHGPKTVVHAVAEAKRAAKAMMEYMERNN